MKATLITDIAGSKISEEERQWLTNPLLGGVILFTRHFESRQQLKELVLELKSLNPNLIISVDHEGGRVQRFRQDFSNVCAMGKLGELYQRDPEAALKAAEASAIVLSYELLEVGIDLTYAPVLDINYLRNTVIGDRAFSQDVGHIIALANKFISGLNKMQFAVVAKHFPGHGWVNLDSHVACPVDERSLEEIKNRDMQPFVQLLDKIDWMMPAHVVYEQVDSEPAGFSSKWLQQILKQDMKFSGHIVSDDLSMQGAAIKGDYQARSAAALTAGCDILLACNSSDASTQILAAMEALNVEPLSLEKYRPDINLLTKNNTLYMNAKHVLMSMELIK
ncbi:MAG: beta-N-acetylhexosaminidase [Psychrobacter glaciei]